MKRKNLSALCPRTCGLAVVAATGAVLLLSRLLPPMDHGPVLCLFRALSGLPCPSCGMTRAFIALGHGNVPGALHFNIASPAIYASAVVVFGLACAQAAINRALLPAAWKAVRRPLVAGAVVLMGAAWILNLAQRFRIFAG